MADSPSTPDRDDLKQTAREEFESEMLKGTVGRERGAEKKTKKELREALHSTEKTIRTLDGAYRLSDDEIAAILSNEDRDEKNETTQKMMKNIFGRIVFDMLEELASKPEREKKEYLLALAEELDVPANNTLSNEQVRRKIAEELMDRDLIYCSFRVSKTSSQRPVFSDEGRTEFSEHAERALERAFESYTKVHADPDMENVLEAAQRGLNRVPLTKAEFEQYFTQRPGGPSFDQWHEQFQNRVKDLRRKADEYTFLLAVKNPDVLKTYEDGHDEDGLDLFDGLDLIYRNNNGGNDDPDTFRSSSRKFWNQTFRARTGRGRTNPPPQPPEGGNGGGTNTNTNDNDVNGGDTDVTTGGINVEPGAVNVAGGQGGQGGQGGNIEAGAITIDTTALATAVTQVSGRIDVLIEAIRNGSTEGTSIDELRGLIDEMRRSNEAAIREIRDAIRELGDRGETEPVDLTPITEAMVRMTEAITETIRETAGRPGIDPDTLSWIQELIREDREFRRELTEALQAQSDRFHSAIQDIAAQNRLAIEAMRDAMLNNPQTAELIRLVSESNRTLAEAIRELAEREDTGTDIAQTIRSINEALSEIDPNWLQHLREFLRPEEDERIVQGLEQISQQLAELAARPGVSDELLAVLNQMSADNRELLEGFNQSMQDAMTANREHLERVIEGLNIPEMTAALEQARQDLIEAYRNNPDAAARIEQINRLIEILAERDGGREINIPELATLATQIEQLIAAMGADGAGPALPPEVVTRLDDFAQRLERFEELMREIRDREPATPVVVNQNNYGGGGGGRGGEGPGGDDGDGPDDDGPDDDDDGPDENNEEIERLEELIRQLQEQMREGQRQATDDAAEQARRHREEMQRLEDQLDELRRQRRRRRRRRDVEDDDDEPRRRRRPWWRRRRRPETPETDPLDPENDEQNEDGETPGRFAAVRAATREGVRRVYRTFNPEAITENKNIHVSRHDYAKRLNKGTWVGAIPFAHHYTGASKNRGFNKARREYEQATRADVKHQLESRFGAISNPESAVSAMDMAMDLMNAETSRLLDERLRIKADEQTWIGKGIDGISAFKRRHKVISTLGMVGGFVGLSSVAPGVAPAAFLGLMSMSMKASIGGPLLKMMRRANPLNVLAGSPSDGRGGMRMKNYAILHEYHSRRGRSASMSLQEQRPGQVWTANESIFEKDKDSAKIYQEKFKKRAQNKLKSRRREVLAATPARRMEIVLDIMQEEQHKLLREIEKERNRRLTTHVKELAIGGAAAVGITSLMLGAWPHIANAAEPLTDALGNFSEGVINSPFGEWVGDQWSTAVDWTEGAIADTANFFGVGDGAEAAAQAAAEAGNQTAQGTISTATGLASDVAARSANEVVGNLSNNGVWEFVDLNRPWDVDMGLHETLADVLGTDPSAISGSGYLDALKEVPSNEWIAQQAGGLDSRGVALNGWDLMREGTNISFVGEHGAEAISRLAEASNHSPQEVADLIWDATNRRS